MITSNYNRINHISLLQVSQISFKLSFFMESLSEQSSVVYEKNCPICMELLYLPNMFPKCEHVFCQLCIKYIEEQQDQLKCPLCRTPAQYQSILPLPRLQAKIKRDYPAEYQERKIAYLKEKEKVPITFVYGNTTRQLDRKVNSYEWKFFFKVKNGKTEDYVEKTQIKLHPTFRPSLVTMRKSPFQFEACGWGTFQIGMKVFWRQKMGGSFSQFSHMLEFIPIVEHKFTRRQQS